MRTTGVGRMWTRLCLMLMMTIGFMLGASPQVVLAKTPPAKSKFWTNPGAQPSPMVSQVSDSINIEQAVGAMQYSSGLTAPTVLTKITISVAALGVVHVLYRERVAGHDRMQTDTSANFTAANRSTRSAANTVRMRLQL